MFSSDDKCDLSHLYGLRFYSEFENKDQLSDFTNEEAETYCDLASDLLEKSIENKLYCFIIIGQDNVPFFKVGAILHIDGLCSKVRYLKRYSQAQRIFPLFFCKGTLRNEKTIHLSLEDIRLDLQGKFGEKRREAYEYSAENYDRIREIFSTKEDFVENPFLEVDDDSNMKVLLPPLSQDYLYYSYRLSFNKGKIRDVDNLWKYEKEEGRYSYCKNYTDYISNHI